MKPGTSCKFAVYAAAVTLFALLLLSCPPGISGAGLTSLRVGTAQYGNDYCVSPEVPAGGMLFAVWTKVPTVDPAEFTGATEEDPWTRGNMDVYVLYGDNWHIRCLVGNLRIAPPLGTLNANSMIFPDPVGSWAGDYSYYQSGFDYPVERLFGWVWAAWQVVVDGDSMLVRQWLKIGVDGPVIEAGESDPTFQDLRDFVLTTTSDWTPAEAAAWVPSDATGFQVGSDNGDLCRVRMYALSSRPSLAWLEQIAANDLPDPAAWGDWQFSWDHGAPDRSGHGRDLAVQSGGTLYEGSKFP